MLRVASLIALLLGPPVGHSQKALSVCEVAAQPDRFHGEVVALQGLAWLEGWFLYDPRCNNKDNWIAIGHEDGSGFPLEDATKAIDTEAVRGIFVGRFLGPNGSPYTGWGGLRFQLRLREVSGVEPVRRVVRPNPKAPAPYLEASAVVEKLEEEWLTAATSHDARFFARVLAPGWVGLLDSGIALYGTKGAEALVLPHAEAIRERGQDRWTPGDLQWRSRVFFLDRSTAVAARNVELLDQLGRGAPKHWEYLNLYRWIDGQWRLAFTYLTKVKDVPKRDGSADRPGCHARVPRVPGMASWQSRIVT